ncbi:hypothetical protein L3Q82_008919, partial [Scortum barcoo]
LWEFELEDYDADVRPLLKLAWEVNTSMKMRDVEFEARWLLSSPEAAPPQFQHPKIISQADICQEPDRAAAGSPWPQTAWPTGGGDGGGSKSPAGLSGCLLLPPPSTCPPSSSVQWLLGLEEALLKIITEIAAGEICALFQPQAVTTVSSETAEQPAPCFELKSAVVPAPSPPMSSLAVVIPSVLDPERRGEEPTEEPDSAVVLAPSPPETPAAEVTSSVLDAKNKNEEPTKEPTSAVDSAPPPLMSPPAVVIPSVLDPEHRDEETTRDPSPPVIADDEPPVITAKQAEPVQLPTPNTEPPSVTHPAKVTTSVLDGERKNEDPPQRTRLCCGFNSSTSYEPSSCGHTLSPAS